MVSVRHKLIFGLVCHKDPFIFSQLKDFMSLLPTFDLLQNISALKTCLLNFTIQMSNRLLSFYCIILLVQAYNSYFAFSIRFFFKLPLFLCQFIDCLYPFCLLINVSQSRSLHKSPLKFAHPFLYELFRNGFLTGIPGTSRYISTWGL